MEALIPGAKFPLGTVVMTQGVRTAFDATGQNPIMFVIKHVRGEWGELDTEDVQENEFSLQHNLRLLSAYTLSDGTRFWIITEADRSVTTLLLPNEY